VQAERDVLDHLVDIGGDDRLQRRRIGAAADRYGERRPRLGEAAAQRPEEGNLKDRVADEMILGMDQDGVNALQTIALRWWLCSVVLFIGGLITDFRGVPQYIHWSCQYSGPAVAGRPRGWEF
jgi:hypothetical protein